MTESARSRLSYRDAGVDIDAGNALVDRIKPFAKRTQRAESLGSLGGFGALFRVPPGYRNPVLVSGTDGVGTKLKLAIEYGQHTGIGQDLVAMCVNDLIVQGAEPLFFLDYYATSKLEVDVAATVIESIAAGCELAGCALSGGETAEMPGLYHPGDYDLAGFAVGIVEEDALLDGSAVQAGDVIIGLPSSGPHSNGYSLIRAILAQAGVDPSETRLPDGCTVLDACLAPTRIYVKSVLRTFNEINVHGAVHLTGGGFQENLPRSFGAHLAAHIDLDRWERPAIFKWLEHTGDVGALEMLRTFNCGIGFVLMVAPDDVAATLATLEASGEAPLVIGQIQPRTDQAVVFQGAFA
ncbi:MAG: phosphoribosylformylglycinamidine cyclo-ligase [Gammaproteobacteria bacterium]|nr:phosphoribosylformylglycinamidine cyclo-ligase [Gammaproteobacteria bacterium]